MKRSAPWIVLAAALITLPAFGAVPQTISYQGVLTDGSGVIVPDGPHNFAFSLFNVPSGGAALWGPENQNGVAVTRGGFSVLLGSVTPLTLPFDQPYYLQIAVDGGAPLLPRVALASSPYSLRAKIADETFVRLSAVATTVIGSTWTNYADAGIVLNAPGPGYVVVDSDFWLRINHTNGVKDQAMVGISPNPAGPAASAGLWVGQVSASSPTEASYDLSGHVQCVFPVAAGAQTYWLIGMMNSGYDASDLFWFANMSAIYHYNASPSIPTINEKAKQQP